MYMYIYIVSYTSTRPILVVIQAYLGNSTHSGNRFRKEDQKDLQNTEPRTHLAFLGFPKYGPHRMDK